MTIDNVVVFVYTSAYADPVIRPGPNLALLLLGSYRKLVDAAVLELEARGYQDVRPSLHYAMSAIDLGAETASELGRALSVTKQAAAKTIALLVERGWVAVEEDSVDRRRKRILVTDLGHQVMRAGESVFDDLRRAWADQLGHDELARLEEQLTTFVGDDTIRLESPGWIA
ncbi:MarR family winged helix-turn-helix transcriptional regulator [Dactylosporangium sp. CA-052675]|uniref:MarR family winged helix-turn-helix transcriptional regulator n=1 Tax=Dactylosporangium sp. CA-052675 TaxID=3239927 RepID=UPI003D8AC548